RKAHLWDREKADLFTPGSAPPPVVDTAIGRIGLMICYDLEFPEWVRTVALERRRPALRSRQLAAQAGTRRRTPNRDPQGAGGRHDQPHVHRRRRPGRDGSRSGLAWWHGDRGH